MMQEHSARYSVLSIAHEYTRRRIVSRARSFSALLLSYPEEKHPTGRWQGLAEVTSSTICQYDRVA